MSRSSKPTGCCEWPLVKWIRPGLRYFVKHDPRVDLRKAACPVLALNGTNDLQILVEPNLTAIEKALAESPVRGHRCEKLEKLNHLFQESETGLPQEYGTLTQTISPKVLKANHGLGEESLSHGQARAYVSPAKTLQGVGWIPAKRHADDGLGHRRQCRCQCGDHAALA